MNNYYVFNKTVRGYSHITRNKPCEDSSFSYTSPDGQYSIAIVADGHGSNSCFRSKKGSEAAAKAAFEALKKFGDYYIGKAEEPEIPAESSGAESKVQEIPEQGSTSEELPAIKKPEESAENSEDKPEVQEVQEIPEQGSTSEELPAIKKPEESAESSEAESKIPEISGLDGSLNDVLAVLKIDESAESSEDKPEVQEIPEQDSTPEELPAIKKTEETDENSESAPENPAEDSETEPVESAETDTEINDNGGVHQAIEIDFEENLAEELKNPRSKQQIIKRITDSIISEWDRYINEDLAENPITEEELQGVAPSYVDLYRKKEHLNHIYGTTLIAAIMLPDYLILLHQGDGRCDVFYSDGSVDQPIPWDDRCYDVYTTSMCDDDVVSGFRSKVIDLNKKQVIACYMGSDGVEDSYRTMEGTHHFYRELSIRIVDNEQTPENFMSYLESYLPEFSQAGSGDDVSVSGIVDVCQIKKLYERYKKMSQSFKLTEEQIRIQAKVNSMTRKRDSLSNNCYQVQRELEKITQQCCDSIKTFDELSERYEELKRKAEAPDEENTGFLRKVKKSKIGVWFFGDGTEPEDDEDAEMQENSAECADTKDNNVSDDIENSEELNNIKSEFQNIKDNYPQAFSIILDIMEKQQKNSEKIEPSQLDAAKSKLEKQKEVVEYLTRLMKEISQKYQAALSEYEEYRTKYRELTDKLDEINAKIKSLSS